MQWSPDWRIDTIIAGRSGFMRYPGNRGRRIEHFNILYTNTSGSILRTRIMENSG